MHVKDLEEIRADMADTVGGKAAGLGEMLAAGERVPPGFCLTTEAYTSGRLPEAELAAAYGRLGGGPVAVRSSATAEDLPGASFAGQQDTVLDVEGTEELFAAVRRCWASLDTERADAYRAWAGTDRADTRMAVVVQRMVGSAVAGVMFTADPLTGRRSATVVDAAPGPGTAVVDGSTTADHYVLDDGAPAASWGGCLTAARLEELRAAGRRLAARLGSPQDVEWAYDTDGVLWLLQSRPVTTLFPLPPATGGGTRVYMEGGHMQGMLRPFTPMGMDALTRLMEQAFARAGVEDDARTGAFVMAPIGGRLYMDLTGFMRSAWVRGRLPAAMELYGPQVRRGVEYLLDDPRFAPRPGLGLPVPASTALRLTARTLPRALAGIGAALARPERARERAARAIEELREQGGPAPEATTAERLAFVTEESCTAVIGPQLWRVAWATYGALILQMLPATLLHGLADEEELETVLGGMPHNVTTEMDLALWRVSRGAREHGRLFLDTDPAELASLYRRGALPEIGLSAFLDQYGHRAAAEVDIGLPRWAEDPSPLFATIANYLRVVDPGQAPDRRFERAAVRARRKMSELSLRGRALRPVRGRIAALAMRRSRELTGCRELAKFAWLIPFAEQRRQLLLIGRDLHRQGLLEEPGDIVFLRLAEVGTAVHEAADHRALVAERRADYGRESRRGRVPPLLLSDGTDVEAVLPRPPAEEGTLVGTAGAAGRATGRARVVRDPAGARIEPGEILVAPTTDPGWTPLFMTAAGVVTETGSPVAHGPTVAREYGIPAVICVRDATREIATGQLITVDGTAGTVVVEPGEDARG
ncbi:PEP/pyruvate-binding domain-containing protein [Nocardiopsis sp. LOL_012]|uniref:PEP/pyruvate-binding domain-containing protein n=1 Tax=Nocardiopsis sp. LOL_012 TaxID=3345409 RepID=UPI003A8BB83A